MTEAEFPILTRDRALELLEEAVKEKGEDYVYEYDDESLSCVYRDSTGSPRCLVGHVFAKHGFDLTQMTEDDNVTSMRRLTFPWIASDAYLPLRMAQNEQDLGYPWGEALKAARIGTLS